MAVNGIYGLSGSGIDVDSMVKVGMLSKQNDYDKLYKKEVKNEWVKEAYSNVYSDLQTFTNSTMTNYRRSAATNPMLVAATNSSVATATANADAAIMSHTVQVKEMASNAYMLTGDGGIKRNATAEKEDSIYLKDLFDTTGWDSNSSLSLTVSDGKSTETLKLTYEQVVTNGQTLNDLAASFRNLGLNIKASYDSTNDAFSLYNSNGGEKNTISITAKDDKAAALMQSLNLFEVETSYDADGKVTSTLKSNEVDNGDGTTSKVSTLNFATDTTVAATGKNAVAIIDGKTYESETNKISASNVTYSLLGTGTSTMTVSQDTDKLIDNVKKFVEDYNKMIDSLNSKYNETRYSDYGVLTKSQENGMTKEQVEKWNEKAKSGLLYHDQTLGKTISALREAIYTPVTSVDGRYNSMMSIGIESSTDRGHLRLDEDKLKKALSEEPNVVYQLFNSSGEVTDKNGKTTTDYNKEGVVNRIYDKMNSSLKEMKSYAGTSSEASDGSTLGNLILQLQTKMSNFKTQMDAFEKGLYKKYDAMEQAIQRLSMQMGYISNQ